MVAGRLLVARTFSSFFRSSMMASSAAARSPTAARVLVADGGPLPVVFCGPSGVGKSTLIEKLTNEFKEDFGFSVSHTTRKPRPGEVDGVHYHFSSREEMQPQIDAGEFVESASVHTNLYGTSKAAVATVRKQGRICILDIDIQGVKTCQATEFPVALYCFIAPPTMDVLERRLRSRGTETEEAIRTRLNNAFKEVEEAKHVRFDLWIVNDDLNTAYEQLKGGLLPLIESRHERATALQSETTPTSSACVPSCFPFCGPGKAPAK